MAKKSVSGLLAFFFFEMTKHFLLLLKKLFIVTDQQLTMTRQSFSQMGIPLHSAPMLRIFVILALNVLVFTESQLKAQDETPLGPDSSADDVTQLIDRELPSVYDQIESAHGFISPANEQQIHHITNLLKGVQASALLSAMVHPESRFKSLDLQILVDALKANVTEADVPALLSSDVRASVLTDDGFNGAVVPLGPYLVTKHPAWCNSPAVTATLADLLGSIQTQLPNASPQIDHEGVLLVAKLNRDPKIQAQLTDTLNNACTSADLPPDFWVIAFQTVEDSPNPAIQALIPSVVKAMAEDRRFVDDPTSLSNRVEMVQVFILSGTAPISNPDFISGATTCLTAPAQGHRKFEYGLALARLGDSNAFASAMKAYFGLSDTDVSEDKFIDDAHGNASWIKEATQRFFLPTIVYQGPGDKIEALKEHYQDAAFHDGRWTLTIPGYETTAQTSTSTVISGPGEFPSNAFTESLPLLTSVSSEEEVNKVLDIVAGEICAHFHLGETRGSKEEEKADTGKAIQSLSKVKMKVLLAVMNSIPPSDLSGQSSGASETGAVKFAILSGAVTRYSTQADITDLLEAKQSFVYWVMVKHHPDWCTSNDATSALTSELKEIEADPSTFSRRDYEENSENYGVFESLLDVARLNNTPSIQTLLHDTIEKAAYDRNAPPKLLLAALNAASKSENPSIHGELAELVESLAKSPDNMRVGIALSIAVSVTGVVEQNPSLLRNSDFIASATTCLTAVESNYDNSVPYEDLNLSLPLALLGNAKAFQDSVEIYLESKKNPPQVTENLHLDDEIRAKKALADGVEKWLISSIVYRGSGDKQQDIQNHYRDAIYQNGQWILTMPRYNAATVMAGSMVLSSTNTSVEAGAPVVEASSSASPNPKTAAAAPVSVTVTSQAPLEMLDSEGHDVSVTMAVVGANYTLVQSDGPELLLKDGTGNRYRLKSAATNYASAP